jgi:hypothetical protein
MSSHMLSLSSRTREPDQRSGEGDPGTIRPRALSDGSRLALARAIARSSLGRDDVISLGRRAVTETKVT